MFEKKMYLENESEKKLWSKQEKSYEFLFDT